MRIAPRVPLLALLACVCSCAPAPQLDAESEVTAALEAFYGAIKRGDAAAAMTLIASDATFVESGRLETRAEYEKNHLPADIDFERQVDGLRGPWQVTIAGDTAWAIVTTEYEGTFEATPVNFVSAQLAVLARADGRWLVRAIHWSSQRR